MASTEFEGATNAVIEVSRTTTTRGPWTPPSRRRKRACSSRWGIQSPTRTCTGWASGPRSARPLRAEHRDPARAWAQHGTPGYRSRAREAPRRRPGGLPVPVL